MENVVAFNSELSSLYDSKPPISKAKMASITKSAMRAIKFYKHVVQSVEKFILKCKPEYKVPGLYVIDSIVRQSRHQFGPEKDVFAPRFARNIRETFANLFRCAPDDKSRIIRVLNLWQKNKVFAPEVIQPIFDLADPNNPIYQLPPSISAPTSGPSGSGAGGDLSANGVNTSNASLDMNISGMSSSSGLGVSDDKMGNLPDLSNNNLKQLLNDPNVIRHLQTLTSFTKFNKQDEKQHKMNEMRLQEEAFEKHLQNVLKSSNSGAVGGQDTSDFSKEVEFVSEEQKIEVINLDGNDSRSPTPDRDRYKRRRSSRSRSRSRDRRDGGGGGDRGMRDRRGGGRRSRTRSRSRSPRSNRRRSSRDRNNFSARDKERDREHERERRKRGLPDIKKEHLSVCSTTLWVGHLSKLVYQEELSDTFGEYGDIVSIDQIVPRGCAFIVMNRRQDAYKAMQSLKNHKLQGRAITISWAAGKGVKSKEWKDFWDLELGVTYIPWNKLDESTDLDSLEEGGMFDEDSMPGWMKDKINHIKSLKEKADDAVVAMQAANIPTPSGPPGSMLFNIDTTQPPPPGPPPSMMGAMVAPGQFQMAPPMGGAPRMLGPPMGMPGMPPMGANMVPGMPPPHPMMGPMGMMPGFPPMPGQVGAPPHMLPAGTQFPPPPGGMPPNALSGMSSNAASSGATSDDQMDIEMEDVEEPAAPTSAATTASQLSFNQPPPLFGNAIPTITDTSDGGGAPEPFTRDRNRGPNSRWGGRSSNSITEDEPAVGGVVGGDIAARWRDNGHGPNGMPNFNEIRGRAGVLPNMQALEIGNQPRPDFMGGEFDNRNGPRGVRGGNPNGNVDFFPNMPNRFNQPTSLMQMRIPPPNSFRGGPGGPPMFMRGGGQGGPGNRPPGPGGFFNPRNPFDRDVGPMMNMRGGRGGPRGGGRGGGRGGMNSGPPGSGNWSDEDMDDNFKRRGGPPMPGGNRFRDRDGPDRNVGGRRGGRATSRERGGAPGGPDFERGGAGNRSGARDRNERSPDRRRPAAREERNFGGAGPKTAAERKATRIDTEEDWDAELKEYDVRNEPMKGASESAYVKFQSKEAEKNESADKTEEPKTVQAPVKPQECENTTTKPAAAPTTAAAAAPDALYDELPSPAVKTKPNEAVPATTTPKPAPALEAAKETPQKPQDEQNVAPLSTPIAATKTVASEAPAPPAASTEKPAMPTATPSVLTETPAAANPTASEESKVD